MQHVVDVVIPLRSVPARLTVLGTRQASGLVLLILEDQVDLSPDSCRPHPFGNVFEQMLRAVIEDGVHRVQPKAVEVKLLDPVESIMNDKLAHGAAVGPVKIDCAAPRRLVAVGKSL